MAALIEAIKGNIEEGKTIFLDNWRAYKMNGLEDVSCKYFKVNHYFNFINPKTGVHTQTIECMWGTAKWRNNSSPS